MLINSNFPGIFPVLPDETRIKAKHYGDASHQQQQRIDLSLLKGEIKQLPLSAPPFPLFCQKPRSSERREAPSSGLQSSAIQDQPGTRHKGEGKSHSHHQPGQVASSVNMALSSPSVPVVAGVAQWIIGCRPANQNVTGARVVGQVPGWERATGNVSLSFSLPSPLSKNK